MAESSPLQSIDEQNLLQAALEHPFEPTEVPLSSSSTPPSTSTTSSTPAPPVENVPSPDPSSSSTEDDTWQSTYASQVSEWRAQSASARTKAELTRAEWEAIRAREAAERNAHGQPPESWDHLGDHIIASTAAANEVVAQSRSQSLSSSDVSLSAPQSQLPQSHMQSEESQYPEPALPHGRMDSGSPSQPWEHISVSPTSSYPSMSFPDASLPQSPAHHYTLLPHPSDPVPPETHPSPNTGQGQTHAPPSTFPSIIDNRVAPRTRLSLVLSSLAINLFLPFINGVMLGFGEIFAKDVLVGWLGWKTTRPGSTAVSLGIRR